MKKKGWLIVLIAMLMILSLGITACTPKPTPEPTPEEPGPTTPSATVTLDAEAGRIDIYDTLTLTATTENTDEAVKWETSDAKVATVDGGVVTGVSEGTVTITASAGGAKATCSVTVYNSYTAPVLVIDYDRVAVAKDGEFGVSLKTLWKGSEINETVNYTWTLGEDEDDTVAEVSASGKTATFTGKEYGEATYYVSANVRGTALVGKVTVKVCNVDITFSVANLNPSVNAYLANLGLVATDKDITSVIPEVSVYDKGELVQSAALTWTADNTDIATVDPTTGEITAVGEGVTYVRGEYDHNDIAIKVNAYRSEIAIGKKIYFETYKIAPLVQGVASNTGVDKTIIIPADEIAGTVNGATVDGKEIYSAFDAATKTLTVDATKFSADKNAMGAVRFELNTEKAVYTADAMIVTMAIRSADNLDAFGSVAANQTKDWTAGSDGNRHPYHWDGYFVLANDIEYNKTFAPFIGYFSLAGIGVHNPDTTEVGWANGKANGWQGVFDGQGYNIEGLKISQAASGMFGVMTREGVVKNVSFTHAVNSAYGGYLAAGGVGRFENIYIQCDEQTGGNKNNSDKNAMIYSNDVMNGAVLKNVFIDTNFKAGTEANYGIGAVHLGYSIYQGVYCVGTTEGHRLISTGSGTDDVYGSYKNYTDLVASGADFTEWENDFWQVINGIPYPRNLEIPAVDATAVTSGKNVPVGGTLNVTTDKRAVVTLDKTAVVLGVTFVNGVLSVPDDVPMGTNIGITVTSAFDATVKNSYNFRTLRNSAYAIEGKKTIYINEIEGNTFTVDLTSRLSDIEGDFAGMKIGDKSFTDASYSDGIVTLDKATIAKLYGDKKLTATFEIKEGQELMGYVTVSLDAYLVTMRITTEEQLNRWVSVAYDMDERSAYANGIFELGADIKCTGVYPSTQHDGATDGRSGGFWGTFDGKGHVIDGLHLTGSNVGFVHCLGGTNEKDKANIYSGGVIKNVAFINAVNEGNGGFISSAGVTGTIENVFISIKTTPNNSTWTNANGTLIGSPYGGFTARNVLIEYLNEIPESSPTGYTSYEIHTYGNTRGLYAVGVHKIAHQMGATGGTGDKYGAYMSYDAFKAQVVASEWDTDCWTVVGGVPVHKAVIAYTEHNVTVGEVDSIAAAGGNIQLTVDGEYVKYTLDDAAEELGVTVNHFGLINVPAGVDGGIAFTVTVGSYAKDSIAIEKSFKTASGSVINVAGRQDVEFKGEGNNFAIDLGETEIEGTLRSAKIEAVNFTDAVMNGDELTLDRASLEGKWGEKTIVATFGKTDASGDVVHITTVNIPVTVVTQIIDTADEFMKWHQVADQMAAGNYFDGYFVLGDDINFEGETYTAYWTYNIANGRGSHYANPDKGGFRGTFDGRGHILSNLRITGQSGSIFGCLTGTAVVKNISFINLIHGGGLAVVSTGVTGRMENVFVHVNKIQYGGANNGDKTTIFNGGDARGAGRIVNCFAIIDDQDGTTTNTYGIGRLHMGYGTLNNVYCVGAMRAVNVISTGGGTDTNYGVYGDFDTFKKSVTNLSAFENDFWTVKDGLPVPKEVVKKNAVTFTNTDTEIVAGHSVKISGDGAYRKITVDDAAAEAGIYIDENNHLVVPSGVADTTVTVTVGTYTNDTVALTKTFTVYSKAKNIDIEYYGKGTNVDVNLSAYGLSGTLKEVKLNETVIEGCGYTGTTLSIPKAELEEKENWGEKMLTVTLEDDTSVRVPVTVVTKVITNKAEMNGWATIAAEIGVATPKKYWDGYFVLGDNIQYNGDADYYDSYYSYAIWEKDYQYSGSWSSGRDIGFRGTFDGRGYVIDSMRVRGSSQSVFGVLAVGGVIKNMTFTNYRANTGGGAIIVACNGTVENLYINAALVEAGNTNNDKSALICSHNAMGEAKIRNAFVRYDDGAKANTMLIGRFHKGYQNLLNVYCIGQTGSSTTVGTSAVCFMSTGGLGDDDVWGAYQTAADMKAAKIAVDAAHKWDMNFWTTDDDGLPIPQGLKAKA